jgi:hypothetical protein
MLIMLLRDRKGARLIYLLPHGNDRKDWLLFRRAYVGYWIYPTTSFFTILSISICRRQMHQLQSSLNILW